MKELFMLDAMQNIIANKPDSITQKRSHSPSAEISKLENKFQDMFAKATKEGQETQAKANPLKDTKTSKNTNTAKQNTQGAPLDSKGATLSPNKTPHTKATTSLAPFDFKDDTGEVSKIGLQEKIAKTSKEVKNIESNPLIEALSTPSSTKAIDKSTKKATNHKAETDTLAMAQLGQNGMPQEVKNESQNTSRVDNKENKKTSHQTSLNSPLQPKATGANTQDTLKGLTSMPTPQKPSNEGKTLADAERLAKAKGLNPSELKLQTEEEQTPVQNATPAAPKIKNIPSSAKETITYEYENNVDRIAIVQRGVKKPKNITSKISNEYPTKKLDNENSGASSLKDRPPLS